MKYVVAVCWAFAAFLFLVLGIGSMVLGNWMDAVVLAVAFKGAINSADWAFAKATDSELCK